ncbi:CAP domain-containing protein [Flavobacterium hydatis]|uniref:SCP domain-containing protein n=1 Tax=Flavobacterium hydatis TaxID=991 RepID=A0A086A170_FLAHY|nr:CAP domain-containing protein [Flavobacterium hydatis]KFF10434.1 hypothetical protein IW20_20700 [Flavobacterium hydatis]OXA89430.1 hypothetical protein B0A62_21095 [Flavobacterium hydatis]
MAKNYYQIALVIVLLFTIYSCSNDTSISNEPEPIHEVVVEYNYTPIELETMDLINKYRVSKGLNALGKINYLSVKAEEHTNYMMANNAVSHDNFADRLKDIVRTLGVIKVSENIAYNYNTPQEALDAWLNSPEHKKNIMADYTNFGISVRQHPINGRKYYTNIFVKY